MVYKRIYIIAGIKVSDEKLKAFLTEKGFYHGDPEELGKEAVQDAWKLYNKSQKDHGQKVKLFSSPCCSECTDWLLGTIVHTIYRRYLYCRSCEEFSCCDTCIGQTVYGWYDTEKILNSFIEIPNDQICHVCHSDQIGERKRCKVCFAGRPTHLMRFNIRKDLCPLVEDNVLSSYWYLLDDCLSCT